MKSIPLQAHLVDPSTLLAAVRPCGLSEVDLDTIAWGFLSSQFTGPTYANWTIERRVDAYLARHGMTDLRDDGDVHAAVLQRVLTNIGAARRNGTLPVTTWETSGRPRQKAQRPRGSGEGLDLQDRWRVPQRDGVEPVWLT
ncbi:MAG TPA: hypothetical protein VFK56_07695 [Mycobacterium sp.]|nr:hypothetical protein [Mycobacterium sp.]